MAKWSSDECDCPIIYTLAVVGGKWKWVRVTMRDVPVWSDNEGRSRFENYPSLSK